MLRAAITSGLRVRLGASRAQLAPRRLPLACYDDLAMTSSPRLSLLARRALSTDTKPAEEQDAYHVLGLQKGVDDTTLRAAYKSLAVEWHPDRHQGAAREAAEKRFQEISEAFTVLSDPVKRQIYDEELEAATTKVERAKAAKKYKAATWNTEIPDVQARLRNAKKEDPKASQHVVAGTLAFLTLNFILCINWLAG